MEAQPVTQFEGPDQPVILDGMALDHLRLRLPFSVETVEGVEHQIAVVARRPVAADDRVEQTEIGHTRKSQRFCAVRRPGDRRCQPGRKRRRSGRFQQIPPAHFGLYTSHDPPLLCASFRVSARAALRNRQLLQHSYIACRVHP